MNRFTKTTQSDRRAIWRRRSERGQAMAEFAMAAPVILTVLMAVAVFGVAFDNYLALTFATDTGAQLLSISRGQTTDPCKTASQAFYSAAPQLNSANVKFTIVLNGTTVASGSANPSCSGQQTNLVQAQNASVTATYPCNVNVMGYDPVPSCTLTAHTTELIQ